MGCRVRMARTEGISQPIYPCPGGICFPEISHGSGYARATLRHSPWIGFKAPPAVMIAKEHSTF